MTAAMLEKGEASSRLASWGWCLLVLLAIAPSVGTFGTPWIAEDASILARVARPGLPGDWFGPQYEIEYVARFWRPVVTLSWWLGQRLFGVDPLLLRLMNVGAQVAVVLLLARILQVLGVRPVGVLLGAAAAALFPHQGGTVTWLAGRTDLTVAVWICLALLASLTDRRWTSAWLTVLACASKEFAFVLPVWVFALHWAEARSRIELRRAVLPILAAAGLAFLWRGMALGAWDGGYAGGGATFLQGLPSALPSLARALGPTLAALGLIGLLGASARSLDGRLFLAGCVLAVSAALPLVPLTTGKELEPQNLRLTFVAELGLCIALAATLARAPKSTSLLRLAVFSTLAFLGWRGWSAAQDTREWSSAGYLGEELIATARGHVATSVRSERPVLITGFPTEHGGAYCLGLGVADRFRAPFDESPRPVWPLRPLWTVGEPSASELRLARELDSNGVLWPWEARATVGELTSAFASPVLVLDERILQGGPDRSDTLTLDFGPWGDECWLEAAVYTELGFGRALIGPAAELGSSGSAGSRQVTLRAIVESSTPVATVGQMLMHAADLGVARRAYLELRCLDGSGSVVAATTWIPLEWGEGFLQRVLTGAPR